MSTTDPTALLEELRKLVSYDPLTGHFTWLVDRRAGRAKAGDIAGSKNARGYVNLTINLRQYFGHRLAWLFVYGKWPDGVVDHMNGNTSDNRIDNLRDVTRSENLQNIETTDENKGVRQHGKKWCANISFGKQRKYLGLYETKALAREAYLQAKRELQPGYLSR